MKSRISILAALVTCLFIVFSCKNNSTSPDPDPPDNPNMVSENIGPNGGSVTSSDGLLTLNIPAGALGGTETITVEKINADDLGSEFDELTDGIAVVYDLGPDGLEFDMPVAVSFGSAQTPVQKNDTLHVFSEFLFTSLGGALELLDSLQTMVDFDDGTVTVQGQLSHFSPLATSQANNGVSFFVFGVPDALEIGNSFIADAQIFRSVAGPLGDLVTVPGPAKYLDKSGAPIVPTSSPSSGELTGNSSEGFSGTFSYTCDNLGLGIYASDLSVQVVFNLESGEVQAESFAVFRTTVDCVEEMPTTVDLQIALEGNSSGSVSSNPAGIDCPDDCDEAYNEGTPITLTATPDQGSVFAMWEGDIGSNPPQDSVITITMDQARNITATFAQQQAQTFALTVLKDGDGAGTVTSDPPGIDFGSDNTEDYDENTMVALTATPDQGSEFVTWSGDFDSSNNAADSPTIQLTMDQARSVTGTFALEQEPGGVLPLGVFALPIISNPETMQLLFNLRLSQLFANLPPQVIPALIQGSNGIIILDLLSRDVLFQRLGFPNGSDGDRTPLGAVGLSQPDPGPNTLAVITNYGQDNNNTEFGFNMHTYDPSTMEFSNEAQNPYPSTVDAFPVGGNVVSDEIVIVREGGFGINFFRYNETSNEYLFRPNNETLGSNRYGFEQPVTAYGENIEGALLVVNELGDLYFETRVGLTLPTLIGDLGQRIIRIRCAIPICAATDNGRNALPLINWDGKNAPTLIGDPISVGLGPVDLDLYRLPNGNTLIVTTGFSDNTVTEIEVDVAGNVVNTIMYNAPEGCTSPGHSIFAENPDDPKNPFIIGTCFDTSSYFINDHNNTGGLFTEL